MGCCLTQAATPKLAGSPFKHCAWIVPGISVVQVNDGDPSVFVSHHMVIHYAFALRILCKGQCVYGRYVVIFFFKDLRFYKICENPTLYICTLSAEMPELLKPDLE